MRTIGLVAIVALLGGDAAARKSPEESEGKALYKAGRYSEALVRLSKAAEKRTGKASLQYLLGLTHMQLGNPREAAAALQRAQSLDPKIGFTSKAKFDKKLKKAQEMENASHGPILDAVRAAQRPQPEIPAAPAVVDIPVAPATPAEISSVPDDKPHTAVFVFIGLISAFLVFSFVRERVRAG